MNSFKLEISAIGQGRGQQQPRLSFVRRGISFLLFLALFATSSLPVSAQSIYRSIAVDAAGGGAEITVQPGDTFTVSFGLSYEGVEAGTTEVAGNQIGTFTIAATVFDGDAVVTDSPPSEAITTLEVTSIALGANGDPSVTRLISSDDNVALYLFAGGLGGNFIACNTNGCELGDILQVTYRVATDAVPSAFKIGNSAAFDAGIDDHPGTPTIQRDEFRVVVVRPQLLVDARLNHGADGGTIELAGVIPIGEPTIATLVTANGQMTCLEATPATCEVDTTFSVDIATFVIAFPAAPSCNGNTCTTISSSAVFGSLPAAADFTGGRASISFTGVQYNLDLANDSDDATFLIQGAQVNNSTSTVVRVFIGADQARPTVPDGFALTCTAAAYSAVCSWPAGADDPSPGAGLAGFVVRLHQGDGVTCADTSVAEESVGSGQTSAMFAASGSPLTGMYLACLTVADNAGNTASGSPFETTFMTVPYNREGDEDGNGVPDHLDVFGTYADIDAAIADIGGDADGLDGNDSIAFAYGLPSELTGLGSAPVAETCSPAYTRDAAGATDLDAACFDEENRGWLIHVANGTEYGPTDAPLLSAAPLSSGRYLVSSFENTTVTLMVLTVLPQLGISYPVDEDGVVLAPPDEFPADNPADPTTFVVTPRLGPEGPMSGQIPVPIRISVAITSLPAGLDPAPAPSSPTFNVAAESTLMPVLTGLARHTGMATTGTITSMGSFTVADDTLLDADAITIFIESTTSFSTEGSIACATDQTENADAQSCLVLIGGNIFEPGGEGIVEIAGSGGGGGMLGWLSLAGLALLVMLSGLVRQRGIALAATFLLAGAFLPATPFAQPSTLSDPSHWRIGVDIGIGLIEPDFPNDEDGLARVDDDSDFGWRLSLEHDRLFHKNVGLEIFWADLGEAEISSEEFSGEVEAQIFGLGAVWHWRDVDIMADWGPYASLGYRYVDGDLSGNIARNLDEESENGVYWNIGLEGSVHRNLLGRVFYEAYDEDLGFWGVGLAWHPAKAASADKKHKGKKDRKKAKRAGHKKDKKAKASSRRESARSRQSTRRASAGSGEACRALVPKGMTPKGWYVQAVTYASADRARSMKNQLMSEGYKRVGVAARGSYHAVRIITGTCGEAQRIKRQLRRKLGVNAIVRPYETHVF